MRALILASGCVLLLLAASPALAQTVASSRTSVVFTVPPPRPAGERRPDVALYAVGVAMFAVGWVGGALIDFVLSFSYFESRPPCWPGLCGHGALFAVSTIPLVGGALWSSMVLDTPPAPGHTGIAASGIVATILQQLGIGLFIAGVVGRRVPLLPMGFVTRDGASFGLGGAF